MKCKVFITPGHTPGSTCFYFEDDHLLFSGDTLFFENIGRTDFPNGSMSDEVRSVERLLRLPMYYKLTNDDLDEVVMRVKEYYKFT